jgi:hypothetical protein
MQSSEASLDGDGMKLAKEVLSGWRNAALAGFQSGAPVKFLAAYRHSGTLASRTAKSGNSTVCHRFSEVGIPILVLRHVH